MVNTPLLYCALMSSVLTVFGSVNERVKLP